MGRTAPRSGPCLAPHLPPAPPLHPAIPAGRSPVALRPPFEAAPTPAALPPSGRPPHRLASPLLPAHIAPCPVPVVADLLPLFSPPPLRHRSSIAPYRHQPPAFRLIASLRSVPNRRPRGPTSSPSPVPPPGTPLLPSQSHFNFCASRFAAGLSAPISASLRFPLQSLSPPLASLAARSACRKPRSPTGTVYRPVPDHLSGPPTRPPPISVPPPLRPPPPPPRPIAAAASLRRAPRPRWPDRSCTGPWPWSPLSGLCSHTRRTWGALLGIRALGCALRPFASLPCALL